MQPGQPEPNLTHDCKVMDGAVIIHSLPTSVSAFHEYADAIFIPYLEKQLHGSGCCMRQTPGQFERIHTGRETRACAGKCSFA